MRLLLVAGPPASAALWGPVVTRLAHHGLSAEAIELFDPVPTDATVAGMSAALAQRLRAEPEPALLVAHGTALPIALRAAAIAPLRGLVLSNGPLGALDPITAALCRLARRPSIFAQVILQPSLWTRWLASSAGLRRAVVNPYVMDNDTVVALCAAYLQSPPHRRAVARYLADLPANIDVPALPATLPVLLCWGDGDPLYPAGTADAARVHFDGSTWVNIPGGHHLHPAERPWALADAVATWAAVPQGGTRSPG